MRAGKVRYIGHSTFPVSAIVEGQWTAKERARERFVCEQPPYSILTRGIEADVLPTCQRYGMGVIPGPRGAAGSPSAQPPAPQIGQNSPQIGRRDKSEKIGGRRLVIEWTAQL